VKRPTIKDVAADSGVSKSTVSLVLRDSPQIGSATKDRVRASMARLGYVYNRSAADMRSRGTRTLGLVVTNVRNPYFAELTMAIEEAARDAGFTLLLGCSREEVGRQRQLLATMAERRIDGLILLPASGTTTADMQPAVADAGVPLVLVTRSIDGYAADYVGADNVRAGRMVGGHLGQMQVSSVAFLGGIEGSSPRRDRLHGLRAGLRKARVPVPAKMVIADRGRSAGADLVRILLGRGPCPDAIVAYNDMVAFDILQGLRDAGLQPGRDVAVASFDNVPDAARQVPSLTSADGFPALVGSKAAQLVVDRLEHGGRDPQTILIEPKLVGRDSTALWSGRRQGASA
jgi:LacI family transcriptional regulator